MCKENEINRYMDLVYLDNKCVLQHNKLSQFTAHRFRHMEGPRSGNGSEWAYNQNK